MLLLKQRSSAVRINIVTNTGYYGGSDNKFLPEHAFNESAVKLASRWERKLGIEGTGIKPGFIRTSVNTGALSDISSLFVPTGGRPFRPSATLVKTLLPALKQNGLTITDRDIDLTENTKSQECFKNRRKAAERVK